MFHALLDAMNSGALVGRAASDCLASLLGEADRLRPADIAGACMCACALFVHVFVASICVYASVLEYVCGVRVSA